MFNDILSTIKSDSDFHNCVNFIINTKIIDARCIPLLTPFGFTESQAVEFLINLKKPNFKLYKIKSTPILTRLYQEQFKHFIDPNEEDLYRHWYIGDYDGYFYSFHNLGVLSENEIEKMLASNEIGILPEIYVDIEWVSFDSGGLICLSTHCRSSISLYSCNGEYIDSAFSEFNMVELERIPYGGYQLEIHPLGPRHAAYLSQYEFYIDDESYGYRHTDKIYDYDEIHYHEKRWKSNYQDFHTKNKIHQLEIIDGTNINRRIENFTTPKSLNEAKMIIEDPNSNYLTSPELSFWYSFDKELALSVLQKCPHAIELLDLSLVVDPEIINALALTKTENNGKDRTKMVNYKINDISAHIKVALSKMLLNFYGEKNQIADLSNILDMPSKETDDSSDTLDMPW
jgi:hypothetical protein